MPPVAIVEGQRVDGAHLPLAGDRWVLRATAGSGKRTRVELPPDSPMSDHLRPRCLPTGPPGTSNFLLVDESAAPAAARWRRTPQGPQLIETGERLVAFAVIPVLGGATCPGNRSPGHGQKLSQPSANAPCSTAPDAARPDRTHPTTKTTSTSSSLKHLPSEQLKQPDHNLKFDTSPRCPRGSVCRPNGRWKNELSTRP